MKNRLFYFATCVALALSSVSCSSDDDGEEDIDIPVVAIELANDGASADAGDTAVRCVSQYVIAHLHTVHIEVLISIGKVEIGILLKVGGHLDNALRSQ
jgi:hypothetical protein